MGMQKTIKIEVGSTTPLWPYQVVQVIEDVMQEGERVGKSGWENIPVDEHLDRAALHVQNAFECVNDGEDHLAHASTRLMMAIAIERVYARKGDE